ncbi:FAD binding domain protein [Thelephora ganbajun]|uniref:FAD binding domain protein n=1 Tax=Thelephora ganbajun TaxID=370292 RepID=A0ACB6Z8A5_THEGA|nr:FAD binding domain protein [Thelephora ganbajun]
MQGFVLAAFLNFLLALSPVTAEATRVCKVVPGDPEWPSESKWNTLNETVGGRLIKNVPIAAPCYQSSPHYNATECQRIRKNWHVPEFHEPDPSSVMAAAFSNRSCDPFQTQLGCSLGRYVAYTVNVSTPDHVFAAVNFARDNNVRLIVRNSAHDYMGKSTGPGALAVWTHYLTSLEWIPDYSSNGWTGTAVEIGAGVSFSQLYAEASKRNLTVVGGDCPSVGAAGGYIQGGGFGPLSTLFGTLADNALEFDVLTTRGTRVVASATQNPNLFFALRGGGGGTYGIVWSVTVKTHPDMAVTGASVVFTPAEDNNLDKWFRGVEAWRRIQPSITAAGGYAQAVYQKGYFSLGPLFLPGSSDTRQIETIIAPFISKLKELGLPYQSKVSSYGDFHSAYTALWNPAVFAIQNAQLGGRIIPKALYADDRRLSEYNGFMKDFILDGAGVYDLTMTPKDVQENVPVLPTWRSAQTYVAVYLPWNDNGTYDAVLQQRSRITNYYMATLKNITHGSGAYLNEGDPFDPDWQHSFYGYNYDKLLAIKGDYDPDELLYGSTAVGGGRWKEDAEGRLCPVD